MCVSYLLFLAMARLGMDGVDYEWKSMFEVRNTPQPALQHVLQVLIAHMCGSCMLTYACVVMSRVPDTEHATFVHAHGHMCDADGNELDSYVLALTGGVCFHMH